MHAADAVGLLPSKSTLQDVEVRCAMLIVPESNGQDYLPGVYESTICFTDGTILLRRILLTAVRTV